MFGFNSGLIMKAIVLVSGISKRLNPLSCGTSKQICHIYDKPMIYNLESALMLAQIRDILIIAIPEY
jgi:glucose-1-phosphate thymidylyltransferase